jgi:hypothetical protein
MSKLTPKGVVGVPTHVLLPPIGGKVHHTRLQATTSIVDKHVALPSQPSAAPTQPCSNVAPKKSPLRVIQEELTHIINEEKLNNSAKTSIERLICFSIKAEAEESECPASRVVSAKVSDICDAIRPDLLQLHNWLSTQLNGVQDTSNGLVTVTDKLLEVGQETLALSKETAGK